MISPDFSLTRTIVIDNTRALSQNHLSFVYTEIAARVLAATASIFTAIDCAIHTVDTLYRWLWQGDQNASFDKALFFAKMTPIASLAGIINPKSVSHFEAPLHYQPSMLPADTAEIVDVFFPKDSSPPTAEQIDAAITFIQSCSMQEKVDIMFAARHAIFPVPEGVLQALYTPSNKHSNDFPWTAGDQTENSCSHYYHTTTEEAFVSILKTGRVNVEHQKEYRGAFVSANTMDENFGNISIEFKPVIERLSPLANGFFYRNTYWAGFSRPIPVVKETVRAIIVNGSNKDLARVTGHTLNHLGSKIPVFHTSANCSHFPTTGPIPKEWEDERFEGCEEDIAADIALDSRWRGGRPVQQTLLEDVLEPFNSIITGISSVASAVFPKASEKDVVSEAGSEFYEDFSGWGDALEKRGEEKGEELVFDDIFGFEDLPNSDFSKQRSGEMQFQQEDFGSH